MGIPCEGPAVYIQGNNQSVLANTTIPDSMLKKNSQSISSHFVQEGAARDEWRTTYVNAHDNEADLLMKLLPSGEKRKGFVQSVLHHILGAAVDAVYAMWSVLHFVGWIRNENPNHQEQVD